jgi:hypothetical protein
MKNNVNWERREKREEVGDMGKEEELDHPKEDINRDDDIRGGAGGGINLTPWAVAMISREGDCDDSSYKGNKKKNHKRLQWQLSSKRRFFIPYNLKDICFLK